MPRLSVKYYRRIADPENLPTIVHCTAGKDRTGVTSAVLLLALGVPRRNGHCRLHLSNRYYKTFFEVAEDERSDRSGYGDLKLKIYNHCLSLNQNNANRD